MSVVMIFYIQVRSQSNNKQQQISFLWSQWFSDNSKEAEYVNALARYEHALEEERITFTIKEAKPQTPNKIDKTMDNWVAKETLNKYHTLPPIRALAPSPLDRPQDRYSKSVKFVGGL